MPLQTGRIAMQMRSVYLSEYGRFFSVSYLYLKIMSYLWKININQFNFIMITNREEVLENALRVFAKMNYEKASQVEIGKACGLTKAGLVYYYPIKLDLFVAVIDKYVFGMQSVANKFRFKAATLSEFIEQYIKGVEQTMRKLISLLDDGNNPAGCSFNFYYYHLMMQVRLYYPDVEEKIAGMFRQDYEFWRAAIQSAKDTGEIRQDVDIEDTAMLFRQVFFGLSFEQSFLRGLDIQRLARELRFVYSLLKA